MKVLVTGANGFIGGALCSGLASDNRVIGADIAKWSEESADIVWEKADLTDWGLVASLCEKHSPGVVIHCAGIAHQKIGATDSATYMRVNSGATEHLAKAAAKCNSAVSFIFLSSVSVYGEGRHPRGIDSAVTSEFHADGIREKDGSHWAGGAGISHNDEGFGEDSECWPSSDYAVSKLDAERRLCALYDGGKLQNLVILRLAPVYDREWSLNLDRRVFGPGKVAYVRFGTGMQRMSALARPNLVEFIAHILQSTDYADSRRLNPQVKADEKNPCNRRNLRINVCDAEPYEFNRIIEVFRKSGIRPRRPVISVPLSVVWGATRIAGCFLRNKRKWIHSCYDKLACDLVFDNGRMMGTGFRPRHSLETIFSRR